MKRELWGPLAFATIAIAVVTSCEQGTPTSIDIQDSDRTLVFHDPYATQQINVTVYDENNQVMAGPNLVWSAVEPDIVSISKDGLVTPNKDGSTRVVVRSGHAQKAVTIEVHIYQKLELTPKEMKLGIGESAPLAAKVSDRKDVEVKGAEMRWFSYNPEIATVDDQGKVTGVAVGKTKVIAKSTPVSSEIEVEITPAKSGSPS